MLSIQLHELKFFARHGIHSEEQLLGNSFELNLDVLYDEKDDGFEDVGDTIDYAILFEIVKMHMKEPSPLLEKVCQKIIIEIKNTFPFVSEIMVSLYKLNPPIPNFQGRVGVKMVKKF